MSGHLYQGLNTQQQSVEQTVTWVKEAISASKSTTKIKIKI
jgi:hypothetical protein